MYNALKDSCTAERLVLILYHFFIAKCFSDILKRSELYTHIVFNVYNDSNIISTFRKMYDKNISQCMAKICNHILFMNLKYKCLDI